MSRKLTTSITTSRAEAWRPLFEAALMESDHSVLPRRLQVAKDAVMDHIEDTFDTASVSERRILLAALHTISELQRLSGASEPYPRAAAAPTFGQAA
jgi:hypothetical protein